MVNPASSVRRQLFIPVVGMTTRVPQSGGVNGDAGIQLKLLKLASVKGNLQFTIEEWSGIQRVLAADQAGDNDSYRKCVRALVPQFLAKVPNAK
jgi:hypothetical protein